MCVWAGQGETLRDQRVWSLVPGHPQGQGLPGPCGFPPSPTGGRPGRGRRETQGGPTSSHPPAPSSLGPQGPRTAALTPTPCALSGRKTNPKQSRAPAAGEVARASEGAGGGRSGGGARPQEVLSGAERGCGPDPPALQAPTRRRRPSLRSPRPVSAGGPGAGGEQGRTLREERGRMGRPRTASCCVPSCPPETPRLHFCVLGGSSGPLCTPGPPPLGLLVAGCYAQAGGDRSRAILAKMVRSVAQTPCQGLLRAGSWFVSCRHRNVLCRPLCSGQGGSQVPWACLCICGNPALQALPPVFPARSCVCSWLVGVGGQEVWKVLGYLVFTSLKFTPMT